MPIQGQSRKGIVEQPCGGGIVADEVSHEASEPQWTIGLNVRFRDGYLRKTEGYLTTLSTPPAVTTHIANLQVGGANYWIYTSNSAIYSDTGTTQTDITGSTALTATQANKVTSAVLHGVLIVNNQADVPRYWGGSGNTANLPGWTSTHRCQAIRTYLNYVIALNVTKGSTNFGSMVKWSDVADPGSVPDSWDTTDPTRDAGEYSIAETDDDVVDGLPLGNVFIVYKQRSMYGMQYVQNGDIFRFFRLPGNYGALTQNCIGIIPRGHVVLTNGPDVILHYANEPQSIITGRLRTWLRDNIDPNNYGMSFVVANTTKAEVWVCIPTTGASYCNRALVYNYEQDTWSIVALPNTTAGSMGLLPSADLTWEGDEATWESDDEPWDSFGVEDRLLMSSGNTKIYVMDEGDTADGTQIAASVTRTGLTFGDAEIIKLCKGITPRVDAIAGTVLSFEPATADDVEDPHSFGTAVPYTVGTTRKADFFANGRALGVRISSSGAGAWRIKSMGWDVVPMGDF